MVQIQSGRAVIALLLVLGLSACGGNSILGRVGPSAADDTAPRDITVGTRHEASGENTIWDIFRPSRQDQSVSVNRYLWNASLDVLNFLPVQSVDPFTGVIVTGYGTPPGGGRAYRATIHITDPALEARALRVSLQSRSGRCLSAPPALLKTRF